MEKFDLNYISPQPATFTLAAIPDREFHLRPVSLADQAWMRDKFGDRLQSIFKFAQFDELVRIVFHQLIPEDQAFFQKKSVKFVSEDGETCEMFLGGVKLLQSLVFGPTEAMKVVESLTTAIGVSRAMLDKIETLESEKKSLTESEPANPIGPMSSTFLAPNTDSQASKS